MSIRDWLRGRSSIGARRTEPAHPVPGPDAVVDPTTGELIGDPGPDLPERAEAAADPHTVRGERTIPSVNRERSVQARVSNLLAIATIVVLGGGFLGWYYATQFSKAEDARAAAKKAADARAEGELKLPPLGRIDPPKVDASGAAPEPSTDHSALGAAPPPAPTPPPGPAPKTPEQLALERKLGQPVLLRSQLTALAGGPPPSPPGAPDAAPNISAVLSALQPAPGADSASARPEGSPFGALLHPTATPAVTAQVLPTRRFLLPKGAFVDCTLETALDSTLEGMVTCIGANDVYGADGKVVLLERGTKYVGEKRGEIRQGQARVFVLWNEARTPAGVIVNLASPGTDELGRAGLPGFVDTHFWDRFGAAILISMIDGTVQALANSQQRGDSAIVFNPQGGRDVMTEVLKGTVGIPPTVVKNQGDRIQVLVARDVDFRTVYALRLDTSGR